MQRKFREAKSEEERKMFGLHAEIKERIINLIDRDAGHSEQARSREEAEERQRKFSRALKNFYVDIVRNNLPDFLRRRSLVPIF